MHYFMTLHTTIIKIFSLLPSVMKKKNLEIVKLKLCSIKIPLNSLWRRALFALAREH